MFFLRNLKIKILCTALSRWVLLLLQARSGHYISWNGNDSKIDVTIERNNS